MENNINIFFKSKTLLEFANNLKKSGLKQAYLFYSNDQTKNFAFCKMLSMFEFCKTHDCCFNCEKCKKVMDDNCVDFLVYPKNQTLMVDDINEIINSCYVLPLENECKVYVLNNFDQSSVAVQNKFLKTLEEPPKNVIFMLNATKPEMVLETIKSRCEKITLPNFEKEELSVLLENRQIISSILENCGGDVGNYLKMEESGFDEDFKFCLNMLKNMKASSQILYYSSQILKTNHIENFFLSMMSIFKDMLIFKTCKSKIVNVSFRQEITDLSEDFSKKAIEEILNNMIKSNKELNFNTQANLVIDCVLIDILEEKHKWN